MVVAIVVEDFYGFSDRDQMSVIFCNASKIHLQFFISFFFLNMSFSDLWKKQAVLRHLGCCCVTISLWE